MAISKIAIDSLGNTQGYLYITTDGGKILSNLTNTKHNKKILLSDALTNGALANVTITGDTSNYGASYKKYYINTSKDARPGSISGATDITNYVTGFTGNNKLPKDTSSVSSGNLTYTRYSNIQRLVVDTESSATADDAVKVYPSDENLVDGDILIVTGTNEDRVVTFIDSLKSSGEDAKTAYGGVTPTGYGLLQLDSSTSFETGNNNNVLMLMYSSTTTRWHEINRAPNAVITDKKIRDNDIPLPIKGSSVNSDINGGDVFTPQAGITPGKIYVTGTHSIGSGTYTIEKPSGGTPKEGEQMVVVWNANLTTNGAVNVFGQTLTTDQMLYGTTKPMEIITYYLNGAWIDGVISRSDDASEDALGNPSSNGMILSSTTAGVRSWVKREKAIHTVSATYDAASMAKTVGATPVVIAVDAFPKGALIMCDEAIIEMETALTSGGTADVSIGVNGGGISQDVDAIHAVTDFNAAPFNSATAVTRSAPGGSITILKPASGTCNIEVDVTAADLTGGKFTVTVPYMTS